MKLILCDLGSPLEGDGERSLRSTPHELRRSPTTEMGVQAGRGGNRWVFVFSHGFIYTTGCPNKYCVMDYF